MIKNKITEELFCMPSFIVFAFSSNEYIEYRCAPLWTINDPGWQPPHPDINI